MTNPKPMSAERRVVDYTEGNPPYRLPLPLAPERRLTNTERKADWADRMINRHMSRMGGQLMYRKPSAVELRYPGEVVEMSDQRGEATMLTGITVHNTVWFANELWKAEKGLRGA